MLKYHHMSLRPVFSAVRIAALSLALSALLGAVPALAAVGDTPFGVGVVSPAEGATVSGVIALGGHATAPAREGSFTITPSGGAPFTLSATNAEGNTLDWGTPWNSASVPNGSYSVTFFAVKAADGTPATSSPIGFTVNNGPGEGPFTVTVTAPAASATVQNGVLLSAT